MRAIILLTVAFSCLPASKLVAQHDHGSPASSDLRLFDDLGTHHWAVASADPEVQSWFDQGLRLYYAFNHEEAIRSFQYAQELDPGCEMCAWGEALAFGPNINLPMSPEAEVAARAAVARAVTKSVRPGLPAELIEALAMRYDASLGDRAAQDEAWMKALGQLQLRYPADDELRVLWGEAVMTRRPWDYWDEEGEPRAGVGDALAGFQQVISRNPEHPGACHFYIHAVEKLYPERGIECAERLASLMPGAGHIVHMPGHIYIRVSRYNDAIRANEHAVHADQTYIQDARPGMGVYTVGYYPHNYDFLAFAASMVGREEQAIKAAFNVRSNTAEPMLASGAIPFLQNFIARPYQILVRFGKWDAILAEEAPGEAYAWASVLFHYARGRALLGTGDVAGAETELSALREIAASGALDELVMEFNGAAALTGIAESLLDGWIQLERGNAHGLARLREAVQKEDALVYGEPPEWSVPARQDLGFALMGLGRTEEAEQVYRADLEHFPENGWSLKGLAMSLSRQGKDAEASEVEARFERAWAEAEIQIPGSLIGGSGSVIGGH